jgi:hypothetical protein
MKKTEIILFILICIAFIMKIMNWPYNALIITFSCLFLSMLYMSLGFAIFNNISFKGIFKKESFKSISTLRIVGGVGLGFIFSMLVIYSLFRIQFWPYGQFGLQTSLILLAISVIIIIIFYFMNRKQFLITNSIRLAIIGFLSLSIYLTSTDALVDLYYGDNPEYAKEYKEYLKNPNSPRPTLDTND